MIDTLQAAFFLFLPAGIANMTPVLANKIPGLNRWQTPLDFGRTYRGKRIFGDHKTWRGLLTGVVCAGLVAVFLSWISVDHYIPADIGLQQFIFGAWIGLGALLGDAIESFFKRQIGVPSGHSWFPFDQIDYIIGAIVFSLVFVREPLQIYVATFGIFFGLHLLSSYLGYLLKLKDKPI